MPDQLDVGFDPPHLGRDGLLLPLVTGTLRFARQHLPLSELVVRRTTSASSTVAERSWPPKNTPWVGVLI